MIGPSAILWHMELFLLTDLHRHSDLPYRMYLIRAEYYLIVSIMFFYTLQRAGHLRILHDINSFFHTGVLIMPAGALPEPIDHAGDLERASNECPLRTLGNV